MITCKCCGETKQTKNFTFTTGYGYAKHCRECGVWLTLFRDAIGYDRDADRNRELAALRNRERARAKKSEPVMNLYQAWGIGS